jgi:hypothetical protein
MSHELVHPITGEIVPAASTLPGLIDRARMHLELAKTHAEVFEAHAAAQAARHLAKLIHASNESQAEILRLVLRAELRMVDEIRVARERREIARRKDGPAIRDLDRTSDKIAPATLAEIGVDRRRVHEWRILAEVGFEWIEQQICLALLAGRAPTYEEILRAATGTPCQASSPPRAPRPGGYPPCGRARG